MAAYHNPAAVPFLFKEHDLLMSTLSHCDSEIGQTMAEYSVVLGALILAVIAVIGVFGTAVLARLGSAASTIAGLVT